MFDDLKNNTVVLMRATQLTPTTEYNRLVAKNVLIPAFIIRDKYNNRKVNRYGVSYVVKWHPPGTPADNFTIHRVLTKRFVSLVSPQNTGKDD